MKLQSPTEFLEMEVDKNKPSCYDLKLGLGCNLGKDLSEEIESSQLVKHKDTGLYLQLYISSDYE